VSASTGWAPSDAAEWLRDQWGAFASMGSEILDLQHRAAVASYHAHEAGDTQLHEAGKILIRSLGELGDLHQRTLDQARTYLSYLGLGAIQVPIALLTVFAGLALLVAWQIARLEHERYLVEALEAGSIVPADLVLLREDPPGSPIGALVGTGKTILILAGLALAVMLFTGRGREWLPNPLLVTVE
jgi:hypothetical protein